MSDAKEAGIDQVRILSGVVQFDQAHPRTRVSIPNADSGLISDIVLSLHGAMNSYITVSGMPFRAPQDVRVNLQALLESAPLSLDLTDALLADARTQLDSIDQKTAVGHYQRAMEAWLTYVEQFASAYTPGVLTHDRQLIGTLIKADPLSTLLTRLGDRAVGFGGTLHLFNYLYDEIPLPGVSLKNLLEHKRISISRLKNICLEFDEPIPAGAIAELSGAVAFRAEVVIHNPLREQLGDLENTISASLQDIEQKLWAGGDLMQSLVNAQDQLLALKKAMDSFEARLASSAAEIQQLQASVVNVGLKVDGLH